MVSDLEKNCPICITNCFEKKVCFQVLSFLCFYFFALFFDKVTLWTNIAILPQIWAHIFKTVFPKLFFCLFSIQSSKLSKNLRNMRMKLRNTTIYPPWGLIFKKKISTTYSSLIWNARLAPKVTLEPYRWEESGIFLIRGLKCHNFA